MKKPLFYFLNNYPDHIKQQVSTLLEQKKLDQYLLQRYPEPHQIKSEKQLYQFTLDFKNRYLRKSAPLSKVCYDDKIDVIHNALGLHSQISRVQGSKLKAKREIRVASIFKQTPQPFLEMIVVHELAHFKEKDHNRAFYNLCQHMLPDYFQLELDLRLYLTYLNEVGKLY